jgi:hypothetical protein
MFAAGGDACEKINPTLEITLGESQAKHLSLSPAIRQPDDASSRFTSAKRAGRHH